MTITGAWTPVTEVPGNRDFASDCKTTEHKAPLVWVLLGHRVGDNLQLQALAGWLGWDCREKTLRWRKRPARWTPFYGRAATLKYLAPDARAGFAPPWPDVVLSIGWRSVPVARWIKQECGARLVHIGRPRARLADFDLILTTPQYRLPQVANVVQLAGPMTTLSQDRLANAAVQWKRRLAHLPRPWTAVLIGGDAPPLRFPPSSARSLAKACTELATQKGGSLLIATGPRTSAAATDAFLSEISAPSFCHRWGQEGENPYLGFVALADRFVVTNDSVSMTHEATQTERPVHIFPLVQSQGWFHSGLRRIDQKMRRGHSFLSRCYLWLIHSGVFFPPRSAADYFDGIIAQGRANRLGEAETMNKNPALQQDKARAVHAINQLFQKAGHGAEDVINRH